MKNRYSKSTALSARKIREIVRYFAEDLTTLQAAILSGLNRNSINRNYMALRERIYVACEAQRPSSGCVLYDAIDLGTLSPAALASQSVVMAQHTPVSFPLQVY